VVEAEPFEWPAGMDHRKEGYKTVDAEQIVLKSVNKMPKAKNTTNVRWLVHVDPSTINIQPSLRTIKSLKLSRPISMKIVS